MLESSSSPITLFQSGVKVRFLIVFGRLPSNLSPQEAGTGWFMALKVCAQSVKKQWDLRYTPREVLSSGAFSSHGHAASGMAS